MQRNLAHYKILEQLDEGGMGRIYRAEDTRLERLVAVKVLARHLAENAEWLRRFQREARAVAALNHPNIVTLYTVEEADGFHFLTLELVEGQTLDERIPTSGMAADECLRLAEQIAGALVAAHEAGITHRDLKPGNVMVTADGRVKVLDFGLAKLPVDEGRAAGRAGADKPLTEAGAVMGTFPYMSPEQAKGELVDHRSDIFSFGILLFEMVTGRRPFVGDSAAELISAILQHTPPSVTELAAACPRQLAAIVRRCLEKDPDQRFQTAREVHQQLRALRREIGLDRAMAQREASGSRPPLAPRLRALVPVGRGSLLTHKAGLLFLLGLVFAVNWGETWLESWLRDAHGVGRELGYRVAAAVHDLEGGHTFEDHEAIHPIAVYGGSISYFFLPAVLGLGMVATLAGRRELSPLRVFCLAIALAYAISLPFYLFFPLPERWAYPPSEAILLSDLWSTRLIETLRPISGLDNCFPSYHVAFTVVLVVVAYVFKLRLRTVVLALGATIVLATFLLGIHWIPDIVAGVAVGILSVALAQRLDRRLESTARSVAI